MPFMKLTSALRYESQYTAIGDDITKELDNFQNTLESHDFKVKRYEHLINDEVAWSLDAAKGDVTLRISRYLSGGKAMFMLIKHGDYEKTVPLFSYNLQDALANVAAIQCLVR